MSEENRYYDWEFVNCMRTTHLPSGLYVERVEVGRMDVAEVERDLTERLRELLDARALEKPGDGVALLEPRDA